MYLSAEHVLFELSEIERQSLNSSTCRLTVTVNRNKHQAQNIRKGTGGGKKSCSNPCLLPKVDKTYLSIFVITRVENLMWFKGTKSDHMKLTSELREWNVTMMWEGVLEKMCSLAGGHFYTLLHVKLCYGSTMYISMLM